MSELVERNKFAMFVGGSSFGYCGKVAGLWLFLKLHYEDPCSAILHGSRKLTQAIYGFFKQFGHIK